ncbi:MAG: DUF3025 domain-containing protein [Betaproteobacteria bacterium]|nr:DUF3025 domain-containing protein [Betaproteobacteria bacterium]
MSAQWESRFFERSALYEPLCSAAAALGAGDWPAPEDLQRLVSARATPIISGGGAPIRFVAAGAKGTRPEDRYEPRIYRRGEVPLRSANWHDLFNALAWLTFPLAKAALNARHFEAQRAQQAQQAAGAANRGPLQDALTLFDESGLIVVAADSELLGMLEAFAWKELFWSNRARVAANMRFYTFGHALYEKMLAPFRGITGRAIRLEVERDFLAAPLQAQLELIDAALAHCWLDPAAPGSPRELAPLPVLGVPGWHDPNCNEAFYDDSGYFRPKRITR